MGGFDRVFRCGIRSVAGAVVLALSASACSLAGPPSNESAESADAIADREGRRIKAEAEAEAADAPAVMSALASTGTITTTGPLTRIATSTTLNCSVDYIGDTSSEFYGGTACGTFVATTDDTGADVLYGPTSIPAGSALGAKTPYASVDQQGPLGSGTAADPYRLVTTVTLPGRSGVTLVQTDVYATGQESYTTTVEISVDADAAPFSGIVYRAGDCYLQNSDVGLGAVFGESVACLNPSGRTEQFIPITGGSSYYEAGYSQVWAAIGSRQPFPDTCRCNESIDNGAGLSWPVAALAGTRTTVASSLAFASDAERLDADGDGLLDEWETNGYDADGDGTPELDLAAMGASPDHQDLFIEVDWMERPDSCLLFRWFCSGGRSFAPSTAALATVRSALAAAPVDNPDGTTGIRAHIDAGPGSVMDPDSGATWGGRSRANRVEHTKRLGTADTSGNYVWNDFNSLQNANFESARRDVFHYALYADTYAGRNGAGNLEDSGSSGIARGIPGDAFMLSQGHPSWGGGFTDRQEAGTFLHELGHTLGLRHGGDVNTPRKANYESIMNYNWQLDGRLGTAGIDYSRSALPGLDENALSEQGGLDTPSNRIRWVCPGDDPRFDPLEDAGDGGNVNWNCTGGVQSGTVAADINGDGARQTLGGHDDWANVQLDGGAVGVFGPGDLGDQLPPPEATPDDEPDASEFVASGTFGTDGDGGVEILGPPTLLTGLSGQSLVVAVTNVGGTTADYQLTLTGDGLGLGGAAQTVTVGAGATTSVAVPVDASALVLGPHAVTAALRTTGGDQLAIADASVNVVDPDDPEIAADLPGLVDALRDGRIPGLDPFVATATASLFETLLGPGEPTVPGPPTSVVAAAGPASATVTWTPPLDDGGSAISSYWIAAQPGGPTVEVPAGPTTSAVVSGLVPGVEYTFTVAARNAQGVGAASAPSNAVRPTSADSDRVSFRVTGARTWAGEADVPSGSIDVRGDQQDRLQSIQGSAPVTTADGERFSVGVDVGRFLFWNFGSITVTNLDSGKAITGALWFGEPTPVTRDASSITATLQLPAVTLRRWQPVRSDISLSVRDTTP